jgi:glycosyltransferase involved in cell wall biosynthesis
MNRLLGFCIPTYNRRDSLKVTLKSLLSQIKSYEIPIYISDNASEDGTEDMVKGIQREYPFIFYKKQEFNKGIDINMLDVVKMADTKYAWWLGDDDVILDDTVIEVLNLLEQNDKYDLVLLNGKILNGNLTLRDTKNHIIEDCKDFFRKYCFCMPFGTLIVNVEKVKEINPVRFIGTSHAYSGVVLDYLAEEYIKNSRNKILLISKPLLLLSLGAKLKTWEKSSAKIMLIDIPEWFTKLHPIYLTDAEKIRTTFLKERSNDIVSFIKYRSRGIIKLSNYLLYTRYLAFKGKFIGLLVSLLPINLARIIFHLGKSFKNLVKQIIMRNDK